MNPEFLNLNSQRNYPFKDDCSLIGKLGPDNYQLGRGFLLDATFTTNKTGLYLKYIHSTPTSLSIEIWDYALVCTASVSKLSYHYPIKQKVSGIPGELIFGDISQFNSIIGSISFNSNRTIFLDKTIKRDIFNEVTSIVNKNDLQSLLNVVELREGYNVKFELDHDENKIIIHARQGEGKGIFCGEECPEPAYCNGIIKTINGISPDEKGKFIMAAELHATLENFPNINKIIVGTQIPIARLDCTRPGEEGEPGAAGPAGPTGNSGGAADDPSYCDTCENCNTCEKEFGACQFCENCNNCENCDSAQAGGGGGGGVGFSVIDKNNPSGAPAGSSGELTVGYGETGKIILTGTDDFIIPHIDIDGVGFNYDFSLYGNYQNVVPRIMGLIYTTTVPGTAPVFRYFPSMTETHYKQAEIWIKNNESGNVTYHYFVKALSEHDMLPL